MEKHRFKRGMEVRVRNKKTSCRCLCVFSGRSAKPALKEYSHFFLASA